MFRNFNLQVAQAHILSTSNNISSLKGQRVLVVDDMQLNQFLMGELLKNCGLVPVFARNGQEALRLASEESYVIIFLDVYMPVMDGLQCARLIRSLPNANAKVPIIAITANQFESNKTIFKEAGINSTLVKPITQEQVDDLLGNLFSERSLNNAEQTIPVSVFDNKEIVIDLTYLRKTGKDNPAFLVKMLDSFCQTTEKILSSLEKAMQQKEDLTFKDLLHQLKFPLGVVGQSELVIQIIMLEIESEKLNDDISHRDFYDKIQRLFPSLKDLIIQARHQLSTMIL